MRLAATQVPAEDKLWGMTRCVFRDDAHQVWHASPKAGGFSSRHKHDSLPNLFYVVSGTLHVEVYGERPERGIDPALVVEIGPGEQYTVEAGEWHRFIAQTDVELVEIYYTHVPPNGDITRVDVGGVMPLPGVRAAA